MIKKQKEIIDKFGIRKQANHFMNECVELYEAILEYELEEYNYYEAIDKEHKNHIEEEVADVLNFIEQFIINYKLNKKTIKKIKEKKQDRTIYEFKNKISKEDRQIKRIENDL